jgi:nucleotide sugar dehydrogenase
MSRIVLRPSVGASMLGGSITVPPQPCTHGPARFVSSWTGEEGTAGTVAVVGAGKMGLPLAAQFATHGWKVIAVDVNPAVVDAINAGQSHVGQEPGLSEMVATVHAEGRLLATLNAAEASAAADVVVLIVPVMLDEQHQPDYRYMDPAVDSIAPGVHAGSTVIFETTLPIGDTRKRFAPRLAQVAGLTAGEDFFVAFSPERLFTGAVLANLAAYPKLVGGINAASTDRAAAFYASVLDAEVVAMSNSEAAEFSKLADTTYRDVNIGLANEFARVADMHGIDVTEVIAAANSQPYSHIHMPGIGVGGHCIPVYPHLLLARAPGLRIVETAREVNDGQTDRALGAIASLLGGLRGASVLVLGITYRETVKELAYSRAIPLIKDLLAVGADVWAYDPLMSPAEIEALGAKSWTWGEGGAFRAVVTQTADKQFAQLDPAWFPQLEVVYDGRNSLRTLALPEGVAYLGVGVQAQTRVRAGA